MHDLLLSTTPTHFLNRIGFGTNQAVCKIAMRPRGWKTSEFHGEERMINSPWAEARPPQIQAVYHQPRLIAENQIELTVSLSWWLSNQICSRVGLEGLEKIFRVLIKYTWIPSTSVFWAFKHVGHTNCTCTRMMYRKKGQLKDSSLRICFDSVENFYA